MKIRIRLTAAEDESTCVVEVVDNPWWRVDLDDDHWRTVSGGLTGVSASRGTWGRFASMLNLHGMARLDGFSNPIRVGDSGDGLSPGAGPVGWEVLSII